MGPLEGIRVLDLTRNVAGPYATKLLAEYGADVLKVEPPGGDPSRQFGPFQNDVPDLETSGLFLHLNTGKRSIELDITTEAGGRRVREIVADAEVVIEDLGPGETDRLGFGWATLSTGHPTLVMCSVTPFGQDGPYRDFRASEITLQAIGGPMHLNGHADREPIKLGGHVAQYHAGTVAAFAILQALRRVEHGGLGDLIDLAMYECQTGNRDRRTINLVATAYTGMVAKRGGTDSLLGSGVRACLDGYINISGNGPRLSNLLKMIGREDLLANPDIRKPAGSMPAELEAEIEASYGTYLKTHGKLEALAAAQTNRMPSGAILTIDDLIHDRHYRDRGAWDIIEHPRTGPLEYPGRQLLFSASTRPTPRRAPLLDEHGAAVEAGDVWAMSAERWRPPSATGTPAQRPPYEHGRLPLEGLRVADMTVVWAGPHVTQLLAEWGAEVIRVEPTTRIQPSTRGAEQIFSKEQARALGEAGRMLGAYPDFDHAGEPWNRYPAFTSHARNKKSMACDVMSPEGREAFLRLIAVSDVFVENNVPETIERANITWEELRKVNPRLVMLRMPAFGLEGPYKNYRAFGHQAEGMIGHHYLRGYPDAGPEYTGAALTSDGFAGVLGAVAVLMGLRHRERTGEGQQVEMPLAESFIPVLGEYILDYSMNGRVADPQGNLHPHHAPHGVYPTAGNDQWLALDIDSDEAFRALCGVLGAPALAADARFLDMASRLACRPALDEAISRITRPHDKERLFRQLQAVGVIAAPIHDELEALADPQLKARSWFQELDTPGGGRHRYPGYQFKMRNTPNAVRTPPVRLGEHNEEIYLDLLGYSKVEYEDLVARGLVGTRYPDSVLTPV
ncbi:MAG: CoA transferase [Dehalococcoidia bacterium]|nr:CoA transferase [Dehalococcoidia bacterium]